MTAESVMSLSPLSRSAKVLVYCSNRYLGYIVMSLILLGFTSYPVSKTCLILS